jgi:F-type H+-transporting ATPase subunit a
VTFGMTIVAVGAEAGGKAAAVEAFILHHMMDSRRMDLARNVHVQLPVFLTLHGTMVVFSALLLIAIAGWAARRRTSIPTGLNNLLEAFVKFVRDQVAVPYLGPEDGVRMTPLLCTFFSFILMMNLVGLVPCFYTATSNINVTGALAAITFGFMIFGAIYRHGLVGFVRGFVPPGVPWPIAVVLVPLEIIGLLIKGVALTVRLFANELAGHIVVFSLLGLVVMFGYVALPAIVMALGIYVLELFVAFLQAYIFTLLSAIFIGQRYHPAH